MTQTTPEESLVDALLEMSRLAQGACAVIREKYPHLYPEWDGTEKRSETRMPYPECCDD